MSELREYVKLRYMGDCKCGDCQLVPTKVLYEEDAKFDALLKVLEGIAEFCTADASKLGAIDRLASIRNTALNVLRHEQRKAQHDPKGMYEPTDHHEVVAVLRLHVRGGIRMRGYAARSPLAVSFVSDMSRE